MRLAAPSRTSAVIVAFALALASIGLTAPAAHAASALNVTRFDDPALTGCAVDSGTSLRSALCTANSAGGASDILASGGVHEPPRALRGRHAGRRGDLPARRRRPPQPRCTQRHPAGAERRPRDDRQRHGTAVRLDRHRGRGQRLRRRRDHRRLGRLRRSWTPRATDARRYVTTPPTRHPAHPQPIRAAASSSSAARPRHRLPHRNNSAGDAAGGGIVYQGAASLRCSCWSRTPSSRETLSAAGGENGGAATMVTNLSGGRTMTIRNSRFRRATP